MTKGEFQSQWLWVHGVTTDSFNTHQPSYKPFTWEEFEWAWESYVKESIKVEKSYNDYVKEKQERFRRKHWK